MPFSPRNSEVSYFKRVLENSGVKLTNDDNPFIITQEPSLVIRDIENTLKDADRVVNNIEEFVSGLKTLCSNDLNYRRALLPTSLKKSSDDDHVNSVQQECLFRILLNISPVQTYVINILLEQLSEQACEDLTDTSSLRLILNSLRYLPFIKEPDEFTSKLLDVIEISSTSTQLEILNYIPEIIPDNKNDETAKQLSKLLEENEYLAGAIIDCLNSFSLSPDARYIIQDYILDRLLSSTRYYKIFSILFEFLITDCKQENFINILIKTRNTLDNIMKSQSRDSEAESNKVLIFKKLQTLARIKKNLFEGIVNMMTTIKDSSEHKPIDVLLLFMLLSVSNTKRKIIETIFKKRIKCSLFKINLFERFFEKYFVKQIFNDYMDSIIKIASCLLQVNNDQILIDIGSLIFKSLFMHQHCSRMQRQDILYNLILLMGSSNSKNSGAVLIIIKDLLNDPKLREYTGQLMGILERLDTLNLKNVKQLFEILCWLTCREDAGSAQTGFKDEIHMLVQKQLSSLKRDIKHRGIISAIVMVKHIVTILGEENEPEIDDDASFADISDLPNERAQEAARLLELTNKCAAGLPEILGLYYDELSSMVVSSENLDKYFMAWLNETVMNDFQNTFVGETHLNTVNGICLKPQYSLNDESEVEHVININIGELSLKERYAQNSTILILSPLFRLLRLITHKLNNGDLSLIDAVLGCEIILPDLEDLDVYESDQLKQVADCIFHCINWFREIISAFVTQGTKKIRQKVISRLMQLISLENLLSKCMDNIPEHKLPVSYFDNVTQNIKPASPKKSESRSKPPAKKFKSNPIINDTIASTSGLTPTTTQTLSKRPQKCYTIDYKFREIDTDVIILLKYPLNIFNKNKTATTTLHFKQFQFILKDFISKLKVLTKQKDIGLSHLNIVDPINIITDCKQLIPQIAPQTNAIVEEIGRLLESNSGHYDLPTMFNEDATDLKVSLLLVLEFYSLIFKWSGFQHVKHLNLLQDILKCSRTFETSPTSSLLSLNRLVTEFINKLYTYTDQCLYLQSAVFIVEIMQALYSVHAVPEVRKTIVTTSEKLLKKHWFNLEGKQEAGKVANANIEILVKAFLTEVKIKTICGLVGTLQNEVEALKTRDDCLPMFESINKANFFVLYRSLCNSLLERVKSETASLTNSEHLILWRTTTLTLQGLMTIVKVYETRSNLTCFLNKSIGILKVFLSSGIPILEIMLPSKPDEVLEIFKILQTSTRFLHHLCCYSKSIRDSSLMTYVPQFRLTLETLVYRVKAALVANNCSQAFWMGNLRNRDLHGDDILSQSTVSSDRTQEDEDEEEDLPDDESDNESNEILPQTETDHSASEIFE